MQHCTCGCAARWCARADALLRVPGFHVVEVIERPVDRVARLRRLELVVETDDEAAGCPSCGVLAVGHGRREHFAADAPCFGVSTIIRWRKRVWRCPEPACPTVTFSEQHPFVPARANLTARAVVWATDALEHDDTTVAALARHLGVDWHTCWDAVEREAARRLARPGRLAGIRALGVDEHVWRPSKVGAKDRAVTGVVDLTRDEHGNLHARLLDVVVGRSGTAYAAWLQQQTREFVDGIEHASLDPFRGYANAIRDELPDSVAVLDAFHVVRLGTQVVDEVRRRVQQDTLGHRGFKDDPLYRIRGLLCRGAEHLNDRQLAKLNRCLHAGDPSWEVTIAWHAYQQLRATYQASDPAAGRRLAEELIATLPTCPVPEVARLGRTLRSWQTHVLARFATAEIGAGRISNGGTEAVNLLIEKVRRLAHGFRTFEHYRLRILLTAAGTRRYRPRPRLDP
ncbi:MAG: ISL3 family transposase [Actinobacteria bacterium]|nr:ISL3 family transposase [Actinomycetota bacterium]